MRTMEVLAPAGNLEIFKTVIDAGADAVYFGGKLFSARAYADNFDLEDSALALEYAHLHDKKAYLTLNTLVKNIEFNKELFDYINFYYQNGLDGIIVQDIGVIKYIRDNFPALNVHGSTQLAICNEDGANLMQDMGVTRVVPARELSLDEIKKIHDNTNLELEIFVHGALCYSYSGDCLFSSMVGGRSGNRGRCAQPCRLEYSVYDGQKAVKTKGGYILSLKDLCGIDDLYNLYKSGASSLKIEGRMKQKQYASNVVNIYKRYVDRVMENVLSEKEEYIVDEVDKKLLYDLGNRCGFTDSYYYNKTDDMVTFTRPNHQSKDIDYEYFEDKLQVKCSFTAHINRETELEINYKDISVKRFGKLTELAGKKPVSIEDIDKRLKKTGNTSFEIADVTYDIDYNIFIPLGEINRLRREALDELKSNIISNYKRESIDSKLLSKNNRKHNHSKADYTFTGKKEEGYNNDCKSEKVSGLIITVGSKEQLSAICNTDNLGDYDLIIPMDNYELFKCVANRKSDYSAKRIFAKLPVVIRDKSKDTLVDSIDILQIYDGVVVSGYDGLYFAKKHLNKPIIADSSLYSYNNYAIDTIAGLGVDINVAPLELNNKELSHRNNKNSVLTIYGRIPMMITNNCINKNCNYCDNTEKLLTIKDKKGHSFPVRNFCKMCYNVIYNESPTCLFNESDKINKLKFSGLKIDFTDESGELTKKILKLYADSFIYDKAINIDFGYTKGHFNRGVE